jgi:urease accessory protein
MFTGIAMNDRRATRDMFRLAAWLSPAFPVGAYTYSSGLEFAVEEGLVSDAPSLETWLGGMFRFGAAAVDGGFFCIAHRAARFGNEDALAEVLEWADVLRPTAELALESAAQGEAFLKTMRAAWPHEGLETLASLCTAQGRKPAYAVAAGAACGCHGLALETSVVALLHALAANLVSAAVRVIPLGQTDGQRVTAALEPAIAELAETVKDKALDELGAATPMVDWTSMRHETQHTRLFRS